MFEAVELASTQSFIDEDVRDSLLSSVSFIFKQFNATNSENKLKSEQSALTAKPSHGVLIDPSYCDNEKFSDVQFLIEDKKVYAHRIVISAHPKFEAAIQHSNNNLVRIDNVNYDVFKVSISFSFILM